MEAVYGQNRPAIEVSYADKHITPGDIWRIYLKGSDPDGDLVHIQILMEAPCGPITPIRLTIGSGQGSSLSGYLTLNTLELGGHVQDLFHGWVYLWVTLEDRAGHLSNTQVFPLYFAFGESQSAPPQGVFEDQFLGRVPPEFAPFEPCSPGDDIFIRGR